jgi:hypothetical protein
MEHEVPAAVGFPKTVKSRKRGVVAFTENPFLQPSQVTTRRKRITVAGGKAVVDRDTGVIEDLAEIVIVKEVDDEQFVKLFTQNLKIFFGLSPVALKLLQVVLAQIQQTPNRDQVMLNLQVAESYFTTTGQERLSKTSFHRAVHELIDKCFIAESAINGLYFINPHLFFNGDRVRFVNEFRRKRASARMQSASTKEVTAHNDPRQPTFLPGEGS